MRCPACGFENASGIKFCGECGSSLKLKCASCGFENSPGIKFCGECGKPLSKEATQGQPPDPRSYTPKHLAEKILTSRSAIEGERKQVTVLFADVKGSMDLAEQVDPEEWHKIMDRFFAILSEGVHRFEGTINQFTGDGIMALFGAPIAHEDHAQRACYAALSLEEDLRRYANELRIEKGINFSVRMGLNSGEVVVGKIGDDLRMDYTALGHTASLGARMEQIAEPGKAYLTEHTAKLIEGMFTLQDVGRMAVKGVKELVAVYELTGLGPLRTKLEVSRARGFSRFVGREEETASLEAALGGAMAGNAQVVGVVGDAGVGKSRVCYEFAERCRSKGVAVYEAHAVAHGKAIPLLTLLEWLRGYFGISQQDPALAAREKIAGKVLLLDPELTEALPLLFDLLGVSDPERPTPQMDPEARQRQLFAAMRRLMHAQSRREPTVSVIEDLHWIDRGSEAFLENFLEALPGTRMLLVVNFRPEYHAAWMQRSYYQQLPLAPLTAEAIDALLRDLLGADASVKSLPNLIRERTGGNPFFIEEIVQALVGDRSLEGVRGAYQLVKPMEKVAVPPTVQAVLAARIDRLESREKHLLQSAAVIGKEFAEPVLKRVAELSEAELPESLGKLAAAEFIYEEALYPQAEYAFKHPLTQEVAYRSQLGERRSRAHAAVARAIAELYPEQLDERAALLAHHWERASEASRAAEWYRRAALWAGQANIAEAASHWQKVRALAAELPESAETIPRALEASRELLNAAWRTGVPDAEADALFADARTLAERTGDLRSLALLRAFYSTIRACHGDVPSFVAHGVESLRLAEETGDPVLIGAVHDNVIFAHAMLGQLAAAQEGYTKAVALLGDDPTAGVDFYGISPLLSVTTMWLWALVWTGRFGEAERGLTRAREIAKQRQQLDILCYMETVTVLLARLGGNVVRPLDHARSATELAEKVGNASARVFASWALGMAHGLAEGWPASIAAFESGVTLARDRRAMLIIEPMLLTSLAEAYLGAGNAQLARARAEEALALAQQREARTLEIDAQLALARVRRCAEGLIARPAIEAALERALALVRDTGARGFEPHVYLERAALARLTGDEATRERELREAHRLFTEIGAPIRAAEVAKELGLATIS
jgi:class 3 adenylate cyclase